MAKLGDLQFRLFEGRLEDVNIALADFVQQHSVRGCQLVSVQYNYQGPKFAKPPKKSESSAMVELPGSQRHGVLLVFERKKAK